MPHEDDVKIERVSLADLQPLSHNPRVHNPRNIQTIQDSIQEVGFMRPGVIDEHGEILAGNGGYDAAIAAGYEEAIIIKTNGRVAVYHQREGLTEREKIRYAVEDNASGEQSSWDVAFLADMIETDRALMAGIFQEHELDDFVAQAENYFSAADASARETDAQTKYHDVTDHPPRMQRGEIWLIGGVHRLMCGDSTDEHDVNRLFGSQQATNIFTSPPYAEQRAAEYDSVSEEEYPEWWGNVAGIWGTHLDPKGSIFLNLKAHVREGQRVLYVLKTVQRMVEEHNWRWIDEFCWKKVPYPGDYSNRFKNGFEPIYQFARDKHFMAHIAQVAEHRTAKIGAWHGALGRAQGRGGTVDGTLVEQVMPDNVLEIAHDSTGLASTSHPARFPVALPEFFMRAFSQLGEIWADPFGGSGTSIIAGQRLGRPVYAMEKEPVYCEETLMRCELEGLVCERLEGPEASEETHGHQYADEHGVDPAAGNE
jgi:hypothetical protein